MEDEFASDAPAVRPSAARGRLPWLALALLAVLAIGGAAALWGAMQLGLVTWHGWGPVAAPPPPMAVAAPLPPAANVPDAQAQAALGLRVADLEQRIARLDLQTATAQENSARAEGLMIAFAVRRAIERGLPLGFLENQLKLRFGDAQPNAVASLIESATSPVTRDQLTARLDALAPQLALAPRGEGTWQQIERELGSLFVVRKASTPSPLPERRLERARSFVQTGQVEAAINEIERLPQRSTTAGWLATARRYAMAQRALDLIETAALLEPRPQVPAPVGEGAVPAT